MSSNLAALIVKGRLRGCYRPSSARTSGLTPSQSMHCGWFSVSLLLLLRHTLASQFGLPSSRSRWYRGGTDCHVLCVRIVQGHGLDGRLGRRRTHRQALLVGWGPKGRWFKTSRPDFLEEPLASGL